MQGYDGLAEAVNKLAPQEEAKPEVSDEFFRSLFEFKKSKEDYDDCAETVLAVDPDTRADITGSQKFQTREVEKTVRQTSADGRPPQCYDDLAAVGRQAQPALGMLLREICRDAGVDPDELVMGLLDGDGKPKSRLLMPYDLKALERSEEKVADDYDGNWALLFDLVRASVICKTLQDLAAIWAKLSNHEDCEIRKVKNRIRDPLFSGYRDVLLICQISLCGMGSHLCEVQLHLEEIIVLKKNSHHSYVFFRTYFKGDVGTAEQRLRDLLAVAGDGCASMKEVIDSASVSTDQEHITRVVGLLMLVERLGDAVSLTRRQVNLAEMEFGAEHPSTLKHLNALALVLKDQGRITEAEVLFKRELEGSVIAYGVHHRDTFTAANNLGLVFKDQGRLDDAEPMLWWAVEGYARVMGPEHPETLTSVSNLGMVLLHQGKHAAAEPLYRWALKIYEHALGADHPDTLKAANNLGILLRDLGKLTDAEVLFRRALACWERAFGPDHHDTLTGVGNLGTVLKAQGKIDEAEPHYLRALEGWETSLGSEHPDTLRCVNNLGSLFKVQGRLDEAESLYRRALDGWKDVLGPEHPDTLTSVSNLGGLLVEQARPSEAEPLLQWALTGREEVLGVDHPDTLQSAHNLAHHYERCKLPLAAEPLYRKVLQGRDDRLGPEHPDTLSSANSLGWLLLDQWHLDDAEALLRRAHEGRQKVLGPDHPLTTQTEELLQNLAVLREKYGDSADGAFPMTRPGTCAAGPSPPDLTTSPTRNPNFEQSQPLNRWQQDHSPQIEEGGKHRKRSPSPPAIVATASAECSGA